MILWVYIPFLFQTALCLHFFSSRLADNETEFNIWSTIEGILIIILSSWFIYLEILQFLSYEQDPEKQKGKFESFIDGLKNHFRNGEITNWIDLFSGILNTVLVFNEIVGKFYYSLEDGSLRILALTAIAFAWYKVFYWMRLFSNYAFFMNLL